MGLFGLGGNEVLILIIVAILLFFGGKRLPQLARGLGRAIGEFQRGRLEMEKQMGAGLQDEKDKPAPPKRPAPGALKLPEGALSRPGEDGRPREGPGSGKTEAPPESRIVKAARALGIDTEGKTEEELKKEIARIAGE